MLTTLLSTLLFAAQAVPVVFVANASTPASLINGLAVKRDWTLEDSEFCKARAAENAFNAYPRSPLAKIKYIKTFSFRAKPSISHERLMLDYTALNYTSRIQEKNLNALRSIQSRILFYALRSEKQISYEIYFSKSYYTQAGFQVPFPWQEGQWLARQYTAQQTPKYTYLLEMQDRPKEPNGYSVRASVCITVYGIR